MFFIVKGMDGTDAEAPARRQAVRAEHLALATQMQADGTLLMAAAYIDEQTDQMLGSLMIFQMESRDALDAHLAGEPYILGRVWETIDISPCKVPPLFLK